MAARSLKRKNSGERYFDYPLFFVIIFIACFGIIMIYSSSYYSSALANEGDGTVYALKQAKILGIGILWMLLLSRIDYHWYTKLWFLLWVLSVGLMVLTDFTPLGVELNGAKRWIGYGPVQFQTSEIVKVAVIVAMAVFISSMYEVLERWQSIVIALILVLPGDILVAKENLSAGIIIAGIAFGMYFVASKAKTFFLICAAGAGFLYAFGIKLVDILLSHNLIKAYQAQRILVWKDPAAYASGSGYQVLQGLYAIGSGGLFGKGLGNSTQKLSFLPESQNDMIFSIICEELGLFGAVCVILLFIFMLYRFMAIANNAPDMLGTMLTVGVMAHIALQVLMNIAVVTNLMPNTGISLPLISYGGTSMMFLLSEMGMVLGVSHQIQLNRE